MNNLQNEALILQLSLKLNKLSQTMLEFLANSLDIKIEDNKTWLIINIVNKMKNLQEDIFKNIINIIGEAEKNTDDTPKNKNNEKTKIKKSYEDNILSIDDKDHENYEENIINITEDLNRLKIYDNNEMNFYLIKLINSVDKDKESNDK